MANYWTKYRIDNLGSVDISGANATTPFEAGQRMHLKRAIMVVTTATTGASPSVITLARRDSDGGNSVNLGSFTIPSGVAADSVRYVDFAKPKTTGTVGSDGSLVFDGLPDLPVVNPGQEFLLTSDGGGDAGVVTFFIEYQQIGFNPKVLAATEIAFVPV